MTWVRTDDAMPLHPKILVLSDGAFRLWENGLHFANRAATDGRIKKALVATLNHHGRWSPEQLAGFVEELVPSLWIDRGDHYEIHDYADYQTEALKERVERNRAYERERKQRQRERKDRERLGIRSDVPVGVPVGVPAGHPPGVPGGVPGGVPPGHPPGVPGGVPGGVLGPVPSRPDLPSEDLPPTPLAGGGEGPGPGPSSVRTEPTASSRPSPAERFLGSFEAEPDAKLQDEIARAFDRGWKSVTGRSLGIATRVKYHRERLGPLLEWARESDPNDPAGVVERAAKAFAESPDSSGEYAAMPFAKFCSQPGKYATKTSRDEEIERLTAEWIWFRDRAEDLYDWQERAAAREERDKRLEQLTKLRRGRAA